MANPRRAAGYFRVSTGRQADEGVSLDTQEALARQWCQAHGAELVECYVDVQTAFKVRDTRPALKRLEADAAAGRFDVILTYKIDRLARSLFNFYRVLVGFQERDVGLVSLTEPIDLATPTGRAMMGVLAVFAAMFSEQLSERVTASMSFAASIGRHLGGVPPLGYRLGPDGWEVVEVEAAIVREVVATYLRLGTLRRAAMDLNGRHILGRAGKAWSQTTVRGVLTHPAYLGHRVWGRKSKREAIVVEGAHAAILTAADAEAIRQALGTRTRGAASRSHAWTGLLTCADCGRVLLAQPSGHGSVTYLCPSARLRECAMRGISKAQLSRLVMPAIWAALEPHTGAIVPGVVRRDPAAKIARLQARKERVGHLYEDGVVDRAEMQARLREIDALLSRVDEPEPVLSVPVGIRAAWEADTPAGRRALLAGLLSSVEVAVQEVRLGWAFDLPPLIVKRETLSGRHSKRRVP